MDLKGTKRDNLGKQNKKLRKQGEIPAVVCGSGIESTPLKLRLIDFKRVFNEAGETTLIDLHVDSKKYKVLVKNVQYHPITDEIIHVEFYKPNLKEKTEVQVPVTFIGQENNPILKSGEGLLLELITEVTISALPDNIPNEFVVDVSKLTEVGAGITIGDLEYAKDKIEIVGVEESELVAKIDYGSMQEEEETDETDEAEAIANLEASAEKEKEEAEINE